MTAPRIILQRPRSPAVAYRLERETITIGRAASNDVLLDDPALSRHHLELRRDVGGRWTARDLESRNGTLLNGRPLAETTEIAFGDRIALGETTLIFGEPEATSDAPVRERETARIVSTERSDWVGDSPASREILAAIERFAPSEATVLITGENGTGKEHVARRLHERSGRSGPFVAVNCPALTGSLLESELFGVERGVATGVEAREGLFESARGGTLLLDEIGDLDPAGQAKLLRVLQERSVTRVGGRRPIALDVRVLAATNHRLEEEIGQGRFRRDLFHRLHVLQIEVPPLRARCEDIAPLARHFLGDGHRLSDAALARLEAHDFPGNVRELQHLLERAKHLASGSEIAAEELGLPEARRDLYREIVDGRAEFWEAVRGPYLRRELGAERVRELIARAYRDGGGSYKGAARVLRIEADHKKLLNFLRNHRLGVEG